MASRVHGGDLRRSLQRGIFVSLVVCWMAPAGLAQVADDLTARPLEVVETTVGEVIEILGTPGLTNAERRARIEKIAFGVFDFTTLSKLVLARNWKRLDKTQRQEFIVEFKKYLSRNYGSRLGRYEKADVEVLGARVEPRKDVTVFTQVAGSEFNGIEMNYRMRLGKSDWKVIDIVIEGVSMLANFRAQFSEVIGREGPEGLLEAIRKRNSEPVNSEPVEES
ncbi:MAG: ABC transporter substrate-binding protein [Myxococcota bacterium]|nr:ABC transporter substrate-binding protein [Myxococcota bacterium]